MNDENYRVFYTAKPPEFRGRWDEEIWRDAPSLAVDVFRPEGSDHRPQTFCKLLYDEKMIFCIFRVEDQFVRCTHPEFQSDVWKDSCVEAFFQPGGKTGYFNFEFNCGGALLASFVTNPARVEGRLAEFQPLGPDDDRKIRRFASLPPLVEPEIREPMTWYLEFAIPWTLMEMYAGCRRTIKGDIWRANFYKCGNETSHPHWASWRPLKARNFHDPASFGRLVFV